MRWNDIKTTPKIIWFSSCLSKLLLRETNFPKKNGVDAKVRFVRTVRLLLTIRLRDSRGIVLILFHLRLGGRLDMRRAARNTMRHNVRIVCRGLLLVPSDRSCSLL